MNLVINAVDVVKYAYETFGAFWILIAMGLAIVCAKMFVRLAIRIIDPQFYKYYYSK